MCPFITQTLKKCTVLHVYYTQVLLVSYPVVSDSLWPHGLQQARPTCPSPSPRACSSSCSLHWWCCSAISSSDALFPFCPPSFPASGTFPISQLFASDDQNTGVLASTSNPSSEYSEPISLKNDLFDHLAVQGTRMNLLQHHSSKASILWCFTFFTVQFSQLYMTTGKTIALTI